MARGLEGEKAASSTDRLIEAPLGDLDVPDDVEDTSLCLGDASVSADKPRRVVC